MVTRVLEKQLSLEAMAQQAETFDLKAKIRQEHNKAELLRLRAGYDGCGCELCQQFYSELDLSGYGNRVIRVGETVVITAGKSGADLYEHFNKQDSWDASGGIFFTSGKKFGVSKSGATYCLGAAEIPSPATTADTKLMAGGGGVVLIGEKNATSLFNDAVDQNWTAYKLTKVLRKQEGVKVSIRAVDRLLKKLKEEKNKVLGGVR